MAVPGGLCKVGILALALLGCGHHSGPQTPLDDMATCPLSGGLLLPRPCAPSLLSKPPWQQDTTAPVYLAVDGRRPDLPGGLAGARGGLSTSVSEGKVWKGCGGRVAWVWASVSPFPCLSTERPLW